MDIKGVIYVSEIQHQAYNVGFTMQGITVAVMNGLVGNKKRLLGKHLKQPL